MRNLWYGKFTVSIVKKLREKRRGAPTNIQMTSEPYENKEQNTSRLATNSL